MHAHCGSAKLAAFTFIKVWCAPIKKCSTGSGLVLVLRPKLAEFDSQHGLHRALDRSH